MRRVAGSCLWVMVLLFAGCAGAGRVAPDAAAPRLVVLGIAQDGGVPQAGAFNEPGWSDLSRRRLVACLGLVADGRRWMFEATPDFRSQLKTLHDIAPVKHGSGLAGVFLTHAHIGHYTGLMFLGHESMGARGVPVYAMPRMKAYLEGNGPWSQLVRLKNIELRELTADVRVEVATEVSVTPVLVPHRQEYSEVVGFRIKGPRRSVLFVPDIDSWDQWDAAGVRLEEELASVDIAYLDGTFFANGEIPGRDMSTFPHPFITRTMERLAPLPASERAKVRFIHLNHTNPALWRGTEARVLIEKLGFRVAEEGELIEL